MSKWASTMTTSNSDFAQDASLPDIAQLTKLANELFTALPCDGSRVGLAASAVQGGLTSSLPGADKSGIPQGFGLPGEAELQKLLAPRQPSFGVFLTVLIRVRFSAIRLRRQHRRWRAWTNPCWRVFCRTTSGCLMKSNCNSCWFRAFLQAATFPELLRPSPIPAVSTPAATYGLAASLAGFDASLIAGLSPQAYGLPGEAELKNIRLVFEAFSGYSGQRRAGVSHFIFWMN